MNRKTGRAVQNSSIDRPRRAFVKTAAYVAPAILTLKAVPSFASYGSGQAPVSTAQTHGKGLGRLNEKHDNSRNKKKEKAKQPKGPKK